MSSSQTTSTNSPLDPTFRNYTPEQAAAYNKGRSTASPIHVFGDILQFHTGSFGTALDVGCGTGQATPTLARHFDTVVGVDPSEQMIALAQKVGGTTKNDTPVVYEVLDAEGLDQSAVVSPGSVDLLTSKMAAHWFRMEEFWPQAARMVKPGGTVALWTMSSVYCHPSTPNAAAVQKVLSHLEDDILGPYELPALHISRVMYETLTMPWSLDEPVTAFPRAAAIRKEWNRDGKLEEDATDFFDGASETSLEELGRGLDTASMVTRWREAHPELVGTEQDCVALTIRGIAEAMGAGGQDLADIRLKTGSSTTLLLFRRGED